MSNVWATMPYVQLSHKMFVICINNRQNQFFSEMSLRDVMELKKAGEEGDWKKKTRAKEGGKDYQMRR